MPQIVLHLILLSNHKKSKKERRITEIFLQRIPFSLKNYFCLGGVWLSLLGTNAQVLLSARSPSLILRCAKQRRRVPFAGLALSVIASRCHLSQSERPWQSAKFPVWNLYALLPQGEPSGVTRRLSAFAKGSPFGGAGAKRLRGQARSRRDFASVSIKPMIRANVGPFAEGGAASDWESYHLNPHFLKYRIRFPACQRAGFRLRWAARCHAWMAVYWGTR